MLQLLWGEELIELFSCIWNVTRHLIGLDWTWLRRKWVANSSFSFLQVIEWTTWFCMWPPDNDAQETQARESVRVLHRRPLFTSLWYVVFFMFCWCHRSKCSEYQPCLFSRAQSLSLSLSLHSRRTSERRVQWRTQVLLQRTVAPARTSAPRGPAGL